MAAMSRSRQGNTYVKINDEYQLVFDGMCFWIEQHATVKKGNNAGKKKTVRVSGYHTSISNLMESLENRLFLKIENVTELQQLADAQKAMHAEIRQMCRELKNVHELRK